MTTIQTKIQVVGMTCNACVRHVEHALAAVPGVTAVSVGLASGSVDVVHAGSTPRQALDDAIREAGYEVAQHGALR